MTLNAETGRRLSSLDALRGAVMILMALDHVRDFFHADAGAFSPTDLSKTTALIFFTRWITHFCLPVFMFTAGIGAYLRRRRDNNTATLSAFLWKRGLWFLLLELTVMRFAYNFSFSLRYPVFLLVLWGFGLCMLALSALIFLPARALTALSVAVLLLEGLLDPIRASQFGAWAWLWNLIHQPGAILQGEPLIIVTYPLIPWAFVMAAGYCLGQVMDWEADRRRRFLLGLGTVMTSAFFLFRLINLFGDPAPWLHQRSGLFTLLSFFNCTKYPGSLDFLLMTLGPSLLVLSFFEQKRWSAGNPLIVFGRVPLFYFVLHFYVIHLLFVVMAVLRYGVPALSFAFSPPPAMGALPKQFPPGFGYNLWTVYGIWIVTVVLLYPLCRWFQNVRATRNDWWLSYL